ncbi:sugar nucleotide-binding protein [Halomonas sp. CUBES01]|uniref:Sugar nucleotide-binding protein n=1 Tax=Vreelandella gomseomensis TaxID=370766 RepID=A0ABU1GDT9_9GAMM|nr:MULTISPECIES: sugar nucleotide-binding protein [Halomonas]MDR5875243.1 sugar nucleotide-binding protein [Halomonas gomseomensis]MEC4765894.1 sugar nucleotide-binding protein [Halomonas sp. CUBES01]
MKLLILDAGHCLSLALAREASRRSDTELVIEQGTQVSARRLREVAPDAVLIPPLAHPLNMAPADVTAHADAVEACLAACHSQDVALVWCVSDQLYEDGFDVPIDEHVVPAPRDESLRRLVQTGNRIRADFDRHLIVRLGPLFALEGSHAWLNELLDSLVMGDNVRAAEDVIFCPTSADAVALALIGMLQQQSCGADAWGAYHLAGTEPVSAFTFTSMVRTQLSTHLEGRGEQVTLGDVQALTHHHDAKLRRVLNCRRMLDVFGVHQKPWRLEVGRMLDAWCLTRDAQGVDDTGASP